MGLDSSKCITGYGHYSIKGRRKAMEDKTLFIPEFCHENQALFAVFDGHNGRNCSKFITCKLPEVLSRNSYFIEAPSVALVQSFMEVDKIFLEDCAKKGDKSGSTGVAVLIRDKQLYVANTGDSRCIICHDSNVYALTSDHKPYLPFEKDRIIHSGGHVVSGRVEGVLAVARAFGDIDFKNKDSYGPGAITCEPDIKIWNISNKTEFIVLACDGLWDVLSNACVANFVRKRLLRGKSPQKVCEHLVKYAYTKGSKDNISAIIVSFMNETHFKNNPQLIDIPLNSDNTTNEQEPSDISDTDDSSCDMSNSPAIEKRKKKKEELCHYFHADEGDVIDV